MAIPIRMPMPGQMTEECTVLQWFNNNGLSLGLNFKIPPWSLPKNQLLRQAVAYALPYDASALYARNVWSLLQLLWKDGKLAVDTTDEVIAGYVPIRPVDKQLLLEDGVKLESLQARLLRGLRQIALFVIPSAVAFVALLRLHDRVKPRFGIRGIEQTGIGAAGCNQFWIAQVQQAPRVAFPSQGIVVETPLVGSFADRRQHGPHPAGLPRSGPQVEHDVVVPEVDAVADEADPGDGPPPQRPAEHAPGPEHDRRRQQQPEE